MFETFSGLQSSLADEFRRLHQVMDQVFADGLPATGSIRSLPRGSFPAINILRTPDDIRIYLFAPGLDPKKLNVSIEQGLLTIDGERQIARNQKATYYRQERFGGEFHRVISLADEVDAERVEAKYRDGIVQISLHRRESSKPRQIEIH
jgi:HSP20 family protein